MGLFSKLKEKAFEEAKSQMMEALGGCCGVDAEGDDNRTGQMSQEEFEATKPDELRKDIRMISGCQDKQTSADVSNVASFQLPDPAGEFN